MLVKHPDPTVDHVLKTWAPRMIVQGIDYNTSRRQPSGLGLGMIGAANGASRGQDTKNSLGKLKPPATARVPRKPISWRRWRIISDATTLPTISTNTFPRPGSAWTATPRRRRT